MHTHTLVALVCTLAVGWVPTSLASSCPEVVYDIMPNNATGRAVLVVGLSAPFSGPHMGMGVAVRAGLEAAFARANEVSQLKFVLASLDDASDGDRHMNNTETLLCRGASGSGPAFAIAGNIGWLASEMAMTVPQMNEGSDGAPVPYIGSLSSSEMLRQRFIVMQRTANTNIGGPRTGVALTRAGAGDELNAIVAFLAKDWNVLNNTALFYEDTTMGRGLWLMAGEAVGSLGGSLLSVCNYASTTSATELKSMAVSVVNTLLANGAPKAVVLAAQGAMSGAVIEEMASRGISSVKEYRMAMGKYQQGLNASHSSFESYISGRLIVMAATRALELYGWPLTRANFLDAIFRDVRTFDMFDFKMGPYGDGVGTDLSRQTEEDWCNQGAHEVLITQMALNTGDLSQDGLSSYRFKGCSSWGWFNSSRNVVIGTATRKTTTFADARRQYGEKAALASHRASNNRTMALRTIVSKVSEAMSTLRHRKKKATKIVLLWNRSSHNEIGQEMAHGLRSGIEIETASYSDSISEMMYQITEVCAGCPLLVPSTVDKEDMTVLLFGYQSRWQNVYRTLVTPPLGMLSSSHPLRVEYESWVSRLETMDNVFEGFVIGKFLSLVVAELQGEVVTSRALLDTIYAKKYFHLGGNIAMGPFLDEASGERKCNQGMDSVYVTRWGRWSWDYVPFDSSDDKHRCGNEFDPDPVASQGHPDHNIVIISTVVPGAILCASILVAAAITKRARPSLKKMKRSELEIGETIGKGQFGSVHSGDWNGTPVAIRVFNKMAASKEDLRIMKSEMELTHNLHHPNLLMLLGYCESKDDLLIVYVHEYLKRNLHNMNFFNKVAIAFPPIVHGNLSCRSLMIDGSMVTKICDFWCTQGKHSSSSSSYKKNGWRAPELIEGQPPTTATDVFVPKEVVELLGKCWQKQPERRPSVFQILRNWPQTFASAGVFEVPSDISISSPGTRQMFSEIQTDVDVGQGPQEGFDEMMVAVVPQQLSAAQDSTGGMQGGVDLTLASFAFSTESPKGITSENHSSVV
eukprot:m51a1_g10855 putative serine threonine-protein kinase ctr1-like (1030) ;mRNA; r:28996-33305